MAKNHTRKHNTRTQRSSNPRQPSIDPRIKRYMEAANRMHALVSRIYDSGDLVGTNKNFVDGVHLPIPNSFFGVHQAIFCDNNNCALDVVICPLMPDELGVLGENLLPYRETIHISPDIAKKWLKENIDDLQTAAANPKLRLGYNGETVYHLPEGDSHPDTFIVGRAYNQLPGTITSQECLFGREDKSFYLELTYAISGLELGPIDRPYIIKTTVPLTETAADLWMHYTGAPNKAFYENFRASWTSLPYRQSVW